MSSLRERVTAASLPVIDTLNRLPRAVPFLAVLGLMVAGIFVPGWGWVFLLVVVLFLAWTLYLAWPALDRTRPAGSPRRAAHRRGHHGHPGAAAHLTILTIVLI